MNNPARLLAFLLLLAPLTATGASAQTADSARIDRLERDIMLLQRQVARGEPVTITAGDNTDPAAGGGNAAQLEVRLSAIEDEIRSLRGKIEESDFQVRKLTENFEKMQKDVDFRFGELSNNAGGAKPSGTNAKPEANADAGAKTDAADIKIADENEVPKTTQPEGPTSGGDGILKMPPQDPSSFSTPREHYNYAFRLLNQTQYENAAAAFDSFTKKYPKDPLVGNAYYWEGETYYIRRDYVNAADTFRQGFEALPDGPKAADNLLKLAMSLDALGRDKESCVVLGQIVTKFKKSSTSVTDKATQEKKRIGCSR